MQGSGDRRGFTLRYWRQRAKSVGLGTLVSLRNLVVGFGVWRTEDGGLVVADLQWHGMREDRADGCIAR